MSSEVAAPTTDETPMQIEPMLAELYIVADTPTPPDTVLDPKHGCMWQNMMGSTLPEVEARIDLLLSSKTPVRVVSIAHQGLLEENTMEEVFQSILSLHEKAINSQMHKFSVASCIFVPDQYRLWNDYALLNQRLRTLAIESKQQPLFIHKPLLEKTKDRPVLCVNPVYFIEFLAGSSFGRTLTRDGQKKIMSPIIKHLTIGMLADDPLVAKNDPSALAPTPIGMTSKFLRSPSMLDHMKERGMFFLTPKKDGARSLSRSRASEPKRRRGTLPQPPPEPLPYHSEVKVPMGRIPRRPVSTRSSSSSYASAAEPTPSTSSEDSAPRQSTSSGVSSGSSRASRLSSSGSNASSHRSHSVNKVKDVIADRQANDLSDLVFLNSLTDQELPDDPAVLIGDQREKYHQMLSSYSKLVTQNYALRNDVKALNIQLTELQRFRLSTINKRCPNIEKQLETERYLVSRAEYNIRRLKNELATEKSECDRILADFYRVRDEKEEIRKERDMLREAKNDLSIMYDQLLEENGAKKGKKKKARK